MGGGGGEWVGWGGGGGGKILVWDLFQSHCGGCHISSSGTDQLLNSCEV